MSYLAAEPLLPLEKASPAVRLFGSATICYRQDNNKMTAMLSERESPQGSFQALDEITYKETLQGGVFYFANRRSGKKKGSTAASLQAQQHPCKQTYHEVNIFQDHHNNNLETVLSINLWRLC